MLNPDSERLDTEALIGMGDEVYPPRQKYAKNMADLMSRKIIRVNVNTTSGEFCGELGIDVGSGKCPFLKGTDLEGTENTLKVTPDVYLHVILSADLFIEKGIHALPNIFEGTNVRIVIEPETNED